MGRFRLSHVVGWVADTPPFRGGHGPPGPPVYGPGENPPLSTGEQTYPSCRDLPHRGGGSEGFSDFRLVLKRNFGG